MVSVPVDLVPAAYFYGYLLAGVSSLGFVVYAVWFHWERPAARSFAGLGVATAVWSGAYVARVLSPSLATKVLWQEVAYLGILSVPVFFLVFTLQYTGRRRWLASRWMLVLVALTVGGYTVVHTDPYHHLFYTDVFLYTGNEIPLYGSEVGPLFWVVSAFGWGVFLLASLVLVRFAVTTSDVYRTQSAALLAASGLPLVANVAYIAGLRLHPRLDPTPMVLTVALLPLAYAVSQARFLSVMPVAREEVLRAIDDVVLMLDPGGRIVEANPAGQAFLDDEVTVGVPATTALPDGLLDEISLGTTAESEYSSHLDGEERQFLVRNLPIRGRSGDLWGHAVVLTDITTQKAQQSRLERQNERLDEFTSVVSHDLRNPLTVATGYVDLVRASHDDDRLDIVADELKRMESLIGDTLTLARQGRTVDDVEWVDLGTAAERCWRSVETGAATLSVQGTGRVQADPDRLSQVFENLYRNAIEHGPSPTDATGVTITVGMLDDGRGFFVADDGPGIPAEARETVFDLGYSTGSEGTGFGLAIVRRIAESHGWSVRVTGNETGGARFEFDGVTVDGTD